MKLEIMKTTRHKETVEIDLPYYYKHDLMLDDCDVVIYGKIEEARSTRITIGHHGRDRDNFEIEVENFPAASYGSYMTDEYKSSEAEYLAAAAELLAAAEAA